MKISIAVLACAASASAFAPSATSNKATALNSVFDDYVGGVDFRGAKFEFDPVRNVVVDVCSLFKIRWR